MYIKNNLKFTRTDSPKELEQIWVQLKFGTIKMNIGTLYRALYPSFKDFILTF